MTLQATPATAMSASVHALPARAEHPVRWLSPAAGLWVGSRDGEHVGMVELTDGRYEAWDGHGRPVGRHPDLEAALAAIANAR